MNSPHRLVPGFEGPISLVYSSRNRVASARIPITGANQKAQRIEHAPSGGSVIAGTSRPSWAMVVPTRTRGVGS